MNNTQKFLFQLSMVLGWMLTRSIFKTVYFAIFDLSSHERALVEIVTSAVTAAVFWLVYSSVMKRSRLRSSDE